jgi:hypothetical protein
MSDYIRDLEAELVRAGRERQRRRGGYLRGSVSRITFGGALTGVGAFAGIAVAILAILLLGHARPGRPPVEGAPGIPASARSLVAQMAVLRRPQTAADRFNPAALLGTQTVSGGHGDRIAPGLTRLLAALPAPRSAGASGRQERVFLIVGVPRSTAGRRRSRARAFASIAAVDTRGGTGSAGPAPTAIFYTAVSAFPGLGGSYDTTVVPDGVMRVRWDFDGQYGGARHPRPTTVYATIRNNLAFAPASRYQGQLTRVTWYGAHQRVLRTIRGPGPQSTLVYRPPVPTRSVAPEPKNSKLVAQIKLQPPSAGHRGAAGVAQVLRHARTLMVSVVAHRLTPSTKHNAYAIWLYRSPSRRKLLGFVDPGVRSNGVLKALGVLPFNASDYTRILITRETSLRPTGPGKIILDGKLTLG